MAQTTALGTVLQIQTQSGTKANGQPKVKSHNFANVAATASDDDVLAVGQAIAALIGEPLLQIVRVDQAELSASSSSSSSTTTSASA